MNSTFLKWAGGKNWFVRNQNQILPNQYNRYIDPFLGGGALLFYLEPSNAIVSDINQELIKTYTAIQNDWQAVQRNLRIHSCKHSSEYYYHVRDMRPRTNATIAARMIYLNRTCFNGIYRVNSQGRFNVPIGTHNNVILPTDEFQRRSQILQNVQLNCNDFEQTIDLAQNNDFLFCDPPYAVLNEDHRFVGYTRNTFDWNDQIRLMDSLIRARNRGVHIIMTNVNHERVRNLYENEGGFDIEEVKRYSSISGRRAGRQNYSELIISANV